MKYIRVVYARVLYSINDNDVFDNDFQMPQLNAPKSFSKISPSEKFSLAMPDSVVKW